VSEGTAEQIDSTGDVAFCDLERLGAIFLVHGGCACPTNCEGHRGCGKAGYAQPRRDLAHGSITVYMAIRCERCTGAP
jgi:hypothetical protein